MEDQKVEQGPSELAVQKEALEKYLTLRIAVKRP
jgi:hypothetical protein